jgi:ATP-dependent Lon protease
LRYIDTILFTNYSIMSVRKKEPGLKNSIKIKSIINCDVELHKFINEKIQYIQEIIRKTILSIKKNKENEIFSNNDANLSISVLTELYEKTNEINNQLLTATTNKENDNMIEILQKIIDKLSMIICGFGTQNIDDLLFISFGSEYKNMKIENDLLNSKYQLIKEHIQPIGYKILHWKQSKISNNSNEKLCNNKIIEDIVALEDSNMFECFDTETNVKPIYQKIYGIRVIIQNEKLKKTLVINGLINDIHLECFSSKYIIHRKEEIVKLASNFQQTEKEIMERIVETMTFKDILIYGNEDIQKKMFAIFTEVNSIKKTKLDITIKKFLDMDTYSQRNLLINLLIYNKDDEILYICYLLYELITVNASTETSEHLFIYDSLPWKIKNYFKDVVKYTIKFTNDMVQKYDIHKITLEQQIYLMKANEIVKEKAMLKLKEVKGKPDEMGMKAKQYLEGLIKIPFGVYREEPILKKIKDFNKWFQRITATFKLLFPNYEISSKEKYTNVEINNCINSIEFFIKSNLFDIIENRLEKQTNKQITQIIHYINGVNRAQKLRRITISNQTKPQQIENILDFIKTDDLCQKTHITEIYDNLHYDTPISLTKIVSDISLLQNNIKTIENSMNRIMEVLDESIYGHYHAKNQILKIIGQWMNGEQTGYCFGFEGSPGIGKTSLAKKGLANCLCDENNISRPFSFIALGGSCNGNTIEGHGYTYVNSTWGKIADILMESKCMNPIIYVDELDKVSKTENGREIIGIFTHLIDQTQNDCFQDKYFSGIDLDLSKALFIFSYNDPEQIDRILLDRIHRIKFDNLSLDDKMVIVRKFILPEINKKMGFENVVEISDEIIEYIIENYTLEPGVRKLKELLFDLYGEINLEILKTKATEVLEFPIIITKDTLESKYLEKYHKIQEKTIHSSPQIGVINGLWANSLGRGGIIPIQTLFYPSSTFLELRLTGLQGDVMKESMNVAKTLAWNLIHDSKKTELLTIFDKTKCQGLHIHCPEGAISKDGPSAGAAITTAIYSLFTKKQIKNNIAITGEINLQGEVTAIGGLDVKIMGGIKAGVKTFLYPKSNHREFLEWKNKTKKSNAESIEFIEVSNIDDVFKYVFL